MPTFYEFFSGGGMARAGLQPAGWTCLFANDYDPKKVAAYRRNWGDDAIWHGDVRNVELGSLPGRPDLVWASFPCQDLSLAGGGAGLKGNRSGTFWPFWLIVQQLLRDGRAPPVVALENVCGTLTSHSGKDFAAICSAMVTEGYNVGAVVIDAALFVPQSRPRLFIMGVRRPPSDILDLTCDGPRVPWHTRALVDAYNLLPQSVRRQWLWWDLPTPQLKATPFSQLVETAPNDVRWHDREETERLIKMMSLANLQKLSKAMKLGGRQVGTLYRRTRREDGFRVQRAEVRFDEIAGCLRTPAGGSSRQILIFVEGSRIRTRLISARETARLMGLPDSYELPERYNEAYHLTGDGVVVPVVRFLSDSILLPIINAPPERRVA